MAKKTPAKKRGAASKTTTRATKPARSPKQKPAAKTTKSPRAKTTRRSTAGRKAPPEATIGNKVDRCLATLNDWSKDCVTGLRKIVKKAKRRPSRKGQGAQSTNGHHGLFGWIKATGKKELHELARVASRLRSIKSQPARGTKAKSKT